MFSTEEKEQHLTSVHIAGFFFFFLKEKALQRIIIEVEKPKWFAWLAGEYRGPGCVCVCVRKRERERIS
jgi:hypothetical protein